jgi:hypothetical protein
VDEFLYDTTEKEGRVMSRDLRKEKQYDCPETNYNMLFVE